jgi:hypothetical protein
VSAGYPRSFLVGTLAYLGVTDPVLEPSASPHGGPYLVVHAEHFAVAAERAITNEAVRAFPTRVGSVNQWADATDVLERPALLERLQAVYERAS